MNSKQKGDRYERKIAAILTDAFSTTVRRTPMSGAFRNLPGDLYVEDDPFLKRFVFDPKDRKVGFAHVRSFMKKLESETPEGRIPILIGHHSSRSDKNNDNYAILKLEDLIALLLENRG